MPLRGGDRPSPGPAGGTDSADSRNWRNAEAPSPVLWVAMHANRNGADLRSDLAARAVAGDRTALEALLEESAGVAHALARSRLGDNHLAEEAAVDALARVARGIGRLKDPTAYPRWMGRITRRCVADAVRQRPAPATPVADPVAPGPDPVERLVSTERAGALRGAVAALPDALRAVVLLHYAEGLSYREIASVLGVGLGTVARRVERALGALRRRLGEKP